MSSRQEEKERRRRERLEREQAEARKAAMRRRLQLGAGALLGIAAIAAVAVALLAGGGGDDGPSANADSAAKNIKLPAVQIADLDAAAKAAGCELKTSPSEGREHLTSDTATFDGYKTNPPTSGTHRPTPAEDGIYAPGNSPAPENWVHALEHGRILIQYKPGLPKAQQDQLEALFNEKLRGVEGYHMGLMENNTNMPYQVAAVAWTHYLGCPQMNTKVFDAIRAFRERYVDKGPELVP